MKNAALAFVLSVSIAACGEGAPGPSNGPVLDPYADLPEDTLLVRVETNPELGGEQCNPVFNYALRTDAEAIRLNVNYVVQNRDIMGSGFSIIRDEGASAATGSANLSMFDPVDAACAEVAVRLHELYCINSDTDEDIECPQVVFEGTEIFASFSQY